jgi:monofunctional glycosyltransferase
MTDHLPPGPGDKALLTSRGKPLRYLDYEPDQPPLPPAVAPVVRRRRKGLLRRLIGGLVKLVLTLLLLSVLWVVVYKFVAPPVTFTMLGNALQGDGITKQWRPLDRIDPNMARAAIAGEDARFCLHHGFDFTAMEKAYKHDQRGGRIRGGSTISQQTAKNAFLIQGGGYARKAVEAYFTTLIEAIWGKRRIMEVYLNIAETGIGTYGADAAAERYFGHDAVHLTATEAGRIAAVLPLPKKRDATDPHGFVRRHGNQLARYVGVVRASGLDRCLR